LNSSLTHLSQWPTEWRGTLETYCATEQSPTIYPPSFLLNTNILFPFLCYQSSDWFTTFVHLFQSFYFISSCKYDSNLWSSTVCILCFVLHSQGIFTWFFPSTLPFIINGFNNLSCLNIWPIHSFRLLINASQRVLLLDIFFRISSLVIHLI